MSSARLHAEWLGLVDISGPFLSIPVLEDVFPQGLAPVDSAMVEDLRVAWEEWSESIAEEGDASEIHRTWVDWVLTRALEFDDECLVSAEAVPEGYSLAIPEHGLVLRPDLAVVDRTEGDDAPRPRLFVAVWSPDQEDLDGAVAGDSWSASPAERMSALLKATGVRLGLVTNGEKWMVIDAPAEGTSGFATWHARLWFEERATLNAFVELLGIRRFFGAPGETLEALLQKSAEFQEHLTDQLGLQVRNAVEVMVQALDKADLDSGRTLLGNVEAGELYEAAVTVMMRLVFLLCAEERGLLLVGDETWDRHYAVTGLRALLRAEADEHGLEILERRRDAWPRLLSTFRAVYGGVEHDELRLRPYGGSLFDPDRFPFLEGRSAGTSWRGCDADLLPVDNRTALHLLEALQLLKVGGRSGTETRRLSFRELDVENIGYVYEGLLDHLAVKVKEPTLGLLGTSGKEPEIELESLEAARNRGQDGLIELLREQTGRSPSALMNGLAADIDEDRLPKLQVACGHDDRLVKRVVPFLGLVRDDPWRYPAVWREGSWMVTGGADRRETGTHYTPKPLTEAIVRETLEPIVYVGPADGVPREGWQLKAPVELLDLKVCDPAMGSGAFLVQACRYLGDRLVESWDAAEKTGGVISLDGVLVDPGDTVHLMPKDPDERLAIARRLVAERCLYGVDINPMAVEMAKLSVWLFTLSGNRPFGFLDHALRSGDSLLGVHDLGHLRSFHPDPVRGESLHRTLLGRTKGIDEVVKKAVAARVELETMRVLDIEDVHRQEALHVGTERSLEDARLVADLLMGAMLATAGEGADSLDSILQDIGVEIGELLEAGDTNAVRVPLIRRARRELDSDLLPGKRSRRPLHWVLEFPEIFLRKNPGFDGIVGNPPFMGGQKLTGTFGTAYREYLVEWLAGGTRGSADLVAYFYLRAFDLLREGGDFGLLAVNTIAEGDTRQVGLEQLLKKGASIYSAWPNEPWPNKASVVTTRVHARRGNWGGGKQISGRFAKRISFCLDDIDLASDKPKRLMSPFLASKGSELGGDYFLLGTTGAQELVNSSPGSERYILPFLNGHDLMQCVNAEASRFSIYLSDMSFRQAESKCPGIVGYLQRRLPDKHRKDWWLFRRPTTDLYAAIRGFERTLVCAEKAKEWIVEYQPTNIVLSKTLIVFCTDSVGGFGVLQSSIHEAWCRYWGPTLKNDPAYAISDCFETFPFPSSWESDPTLKNAAQLYLDLRREITEDLGLALTPFSQALNNPNCHDGMIKRMREIVSRLDRAVLDCYGWKDIDPDNDFRKSTIIRGIDEVRFTISEHARREILSRLCQLNIRRFAMDARQDPDRNRRTIKPSPADVKVKYHGRETETSWLFDENGPPATESELSRDIAGSVTASMAAENTAPVYGDEVAAVLGWLKANPGWHAKVEIIDGARIGERSWTKTINSLLGKGQIERKGKKRATRYRAKVDSALTGPQATAPPATASNTANDTKHQRSAAKKKRSAQSIDDLVLEWLRVNRQWHPVVRIAYGIKATEGEVIRALNGLVSSGQVQFRTGNLGRGEYRRV